MLRAVQSFSNEQWCVRVELSNRKVVGHPSREIHDFADKLGLFTETARWSTIGVLSTLMLVWENHSSPDKFILCRTRRHAVGKQNADLYLRITQRHMPSGALSESISFKKSSG